MRERYRITFHVWFTSIINKLQRTLLNHVWHLRTSLLSTSSRKSATPASNWRVWGPSSFHTKRDYYWTTPPTHKTLWILFAKRQNVMAWMMVLKFNQSLESWYRTLLVLQDLIISLVMMITTHAKPAKFHIQRQLNKRRINYDKVSPNKSRYYIRNNQSNRRKWYKLKKWEYWK
jgi:hypothetical protein